ncbi:MAG TPA: hypothetical protein VGY77_07155 [Gemmataceae bacterium]|nr:hypothetical protein [Gemmataceae bacterium]
MGNSYCIAGAWMDQGQWRIIRPLMAKKGDLPARNVGWSPYYLDGFSRWDIFEIFLPAPANPEPPHGEDLWVRALKPQRRSASMEIRQAILEFTASAKDGPLFGVPLSTTRVGAYLNPGTGERSLTTINVAADEIRFEASFLRNNQEPDVRVSLPIPAVGPRTLMVKDHHLLRKSEQSSPDLKQRLQILNQTIRNMGPVIAVRLGLSRPFAANGAMSKPFCWLMADGFFSPSDPQA